MTLPLQLAESRLLLPSGLDAGGLERTFGTLLGPGIDFGDLYFQHTRHESWTVEDGTVKNGAPSIEQGVGVRAISGEKTGFAYSDEINGEALQLAAKSARAIARDGSSVTTRSLVRGQARDLYRPEDPIDSIPNEEKVEALRRIDRYVRAADPRVTQVVVSLSGSLDTVLVARSDGVLAADVRPLVRFNVQVIVEQNGRRESGYSGGGGRYGYAELLGDGKPEGFAREALRQALVNLEAVDAPAAAGVAAYTAPVLLDDHLHVEAHQRAHVCGQHAVAARHQHGVDAASEAHHDLLDPRVRGAQQLVDPAQRLDFFLVAERIDRVLGRVQRAPVAARQRAHRNTVTPGALGNGTGRPGGDHQRLGVDLVGIGEAGLLAADRAHADALFDRVRAVPDNAVLDRPAFASRVLAIQVAEIDARSEQGAEGAFLATGITPAGASTASRLTSACRSASRPQASGLPSANSSA